MLVVYSATFLLSSEYVLCEQTFMVLVQGLIFNSVPMTLEIVSWSIVHIVLTVYGV